jgi:hypothetical protein
VGVGQSLHNNSQSPTRVAFALLTTNGRDADVGMLGLGFSF